MNVARVKFKISHKNVFDASFESTFDDICYETSLSKLSDTYKPHPPTGHKLRSGNIRFRAVEKHHDTIMVSRAVSVDMIGTGKTAVLHGQA